MLKKIRDFIYDINDIFVALIILAAAAGIIYWRSAYITAYPAYLAEKNNTPSISNIDFSDIDLEPEPVDPRYNYDPADQGSLVDSQDPPADNTVDSTDVPIPGEENTGNNDNGNSAANDAENSNVEDNSSENEEAVAFRVLYQTSWYNVADDLAVMGLIENNDAAKRDFVNTASNMNLDTKLYPGIYTLKKGMSYEEIIKIICRVI